MSTSPTTHAVTDRDRATDPRSASRTGTPMALRAPRIVVDLGDTIALSERLALTQPIDMTAILAMDR